MKMPWAVRNVGSVTLDRSFCVSALERALIRAQPEIFHADQGAQFTSLAFTTPW